MHLPRHLERDLAELLHLPARSERHAARRESLGDELARVRPRDLEDVELGVDLGGDRAERRDRLVEDHEPRREAEVHPVDQRETLANRLDRVDVREPRAVVAVVELLEP